MEPVRVTPKECVGTALSVLQLEDASETQPPGEIAQVSLPSMKRLWRSGGRSWESTIDDP